jgi:hypothetical protein
MRAACHFGDVGGGYGTGSFDMTIREMIRKTLYTHFLGRFLPISASWGLIGWLIFVLIPHKLYPNWAITASVLLYLFVYLMLVILICVGDLHCPRCSLVIELPSDDGTPLPNRCPSCGLGFDEQVM